MTLPETAVSSGLLPLVEEGIFDSWPRRGIVHVGANDGAEVEWYLDRGLSPVLCFEPHLAAFARGVNRWDGEEDVTYVALGLGSEDGWVEMSIPEDGDDEKTSRYAPIPTEGHDWTAIAAGAQVTVPVRRFDSWLAETGLDLKPYGTLVVDVQGMELEVLEGFGIFLADFDFLCVELSAQPMYEGEPPASEVIRYLNRWGFAQRTEVPEHGDVVFSRR